MVNGSDAKLTTWQRRAASVGFQWWNNKRVVDLSDNEIQKAFQGLGRQFGVHYIWNAH